MHANVRTPAHTSEDDADPLGEPSRNGRKDRITGQYGEVVSSRKADDAPSGAAGIARLLETTGHVTAEIPGPATWEDAHSLGADWTLTVEYMPGETENDDE